MQDKGNEQLQEKEITRTIKRYTRTPEKDENMTPPQKKRRRNREEKDRKNNQIRIIEHEAAIEKRSKN